VRRFPMSWSRGLWATTAALVLVMAGVLVIPVLAGARSGPARWMPLVAVVVLVVSWAMAPRRLAVGGGQVLVERRAWYPVRIPLASLEEVGTLPPEVLRGSLRLGGSGGAFGYYGRYRSGDLGAFRLHATRRDRLVLLRGGGTTWVVTPDRPESFVDAVLAVAPRARRLASVPGGAGPGGAGVESAPAPTPADRGSGGATASGEGAGGTAPGRGGRWLRAAVMIVPVAALAGVGVTFARAPKEIRLERGEVVVERHLWPPRRIPLASIRSAALLPPEALEGARRVRGARVLGALYGTFESPALGRFEIEAPHTGLVLLETTGGDVVVGVVDPDRFQARVAAALRGRSPPR